MSDHSTIEWTDATWNPTRGCTKISPGCTHCYAETFAERFRGVSGHPYEEGFDLRLVPEKLHEPIRWSKPRTVFVNSMSDLFHESVPTWYIIAVANVMRWTPWHTYQVLSKRGSRLADLLGTELSFAAALPNIWWGVSVEDRKYGFPRIAELQRARVGVRFLSIEPLLEDLGDLPLDGIHWVIVGGESGHGAREMRESWVTSIKDQCDEKGVRFFFKQWGGVSKKRAGRLLLGRTWDDMPVRSAVPIPAARDRASLHEKCAISDSWPETMSNQILLLNKRLERSTRPSATT
jgi:protein gp37